jgi:hypothetical protein
MTLKELVERCERDGLEIDIVRSIPSEGFYIIRLV